VSEVTRTCTNFPWEKAKNAAEERQLRVHVCCGIVVWESQAGKRYSTFTPLCAQKIAHADERIAGNPGLEIRSYQAAIA